MKNVMQKAQELAEAILESDVYQYMHTMELKLTKDEKASAALALMIEKRHAVEEILATKNMNPDDLAKASEEMEAAETAMNEVTIIQETKDARAAFQEMMNNVNRILRLVVTGETEDETPTHGGCTGDCAHCHGECAD